MGQQRRKNVLIKNENAVHLFGAAQCMMQRCMVEITEVSAKPDQCALVGAHEFSGLNLKMGRSV